MKYTKEGINKIVNLKGANGELIDIFSLHGLLFVGNSFKGMWNLNERYCRFSEHSIGISYDEFEYRETEEQVRRQFWLSLRRVIQERLL